MQPDEVGCEGGLMSQFGQEGFRWWIGRVIDARNDPLKLGRVRVRIYGVDNLKEDDEIIQWASCITPTTSASFRQIGETPALIEGSEVFGFFADNERRDVRLIIGSLPQQPDEDDNTNALSYEARGKNPLESVKLHPVEPEPAFAAEYPFNRVIRTRKGHTIELDDTDNAERVRIHHANGTTIEMGPDGRLVIRNPGDSFEIVGGVKNIAVTGDAKIEVGGNLKAAIQGSATIAANSSVSIESKGILRLFGLLGVQIVSGEGTTIQGAGGLTVTDGSIVAAGNISSGTGLTTTVVAGGKSLTFRDGIAVRSS